MPEAVFFPSRRAPHCLIRKEGTGTSEESGGEVFRPFLFISRFFGTFFRGFLHAFFAIFLVIAGSSIEKLQVESKPKGDETNSCSFY